MSILRASVTQKYTFYSLSFHNKLTTFRIPTCHTSQTSILVGHVLLTTLWAATLTTSAILDILLEGTLDTILPCVDGLRVEVEAVDKLHNLVNRHALTVNTMDCHRLTDMREALATATTWRSLESFVLSDSIYDPTYMKCPEWEHLERQKAG